LFRRGAALLNGARMSGLRRHIPELAIDWSLDTPEARVRSVEGSLCFADISGFTALAERLAQRGRIGGEELIETLSRVFATMLDTAHARGGMLLKFGGDALLLFFDGADHATRAAATAVDMRTALRRAAGTPTSVGPMRLSMSVGVHSDEVLFFLVGATHRELVLLGPAANTVIETEAAAESGEILLSAATAALLPADASSPRPDGRARLRWRRAPADAGAPRPERPIGNDTLRALFPRELGRHLAPGPPEPEHRVACIAFIRLSGTDAFLAARGSAALADALDVTVAAVQAALDAEGVSLLAIDVDRDGAKFFLGSGVPVAHEDDEGAMLRALRRILDTPLPLPLQAGVNRGHVFVAEVGSTRRAAYSAMGDTTNTAARIASKTPQGRIYAHPSVLDQSLTLFDVRPAEPLTLKGKKAPLAVYDVGDEVGTRRREGVHAAIFVGRERERATIAAALDRLRHGEGGVVSVVGAAGSGKSRLLQEALATTPPATVALRAEPYGASSPYRLFRDPFRRLLGIDRASQADMAAQLEHRVVAVRPDLLPYLALVGDVAHIDVEPSEAVKVIQPGFRGTRRAATVVDLVATLHREPLLFVVEDAHWADEASVELLAAIARATAEKPWLMLAGRRDVAGGFAPSDGEEIALRPLPDDDLRRLVDAATEAAPLRPDEMREVLRRAGGNPLFVMELLRAVRDLGSLDAVPASLEGAMAAQVDTLDPVARRLLRYATVLGRSFSVGVLEAIVTAEGHADDLPGMTRLADYLEADGTDRLRFRNGLLRDVVYESVAYRLRKRLHQAAGETMERLAPDPNAAADSLALHFSYGDDPVRAWRYARIAAERARQAYANLDAARLYELALDAARRVPGLDPREGVGVWRALGDVRELAGQYEASLEAYRRALEIESIDAVTRADLLYGRARAKERAGKFTQALRDLTAGLRLLEGNRSSDAGKVRARLESFAAMVLFGQDKPRHARKRALLARDIARDADEPESLGRALVVTDLSSLALEGPGDGRHLEEALGIFERLGDIRMQALTRANLGFLNAHACRWDEAVEWLRSSQALDARSGDSVGGAFSGINVGEILVNQRRHDEARSMLEASLRVVRASGFAEGVAFIEMQLARIHVDQGETDTAYTLLDGAKAEFERLGNATLVLEAAIVRADGMLRTGEASAALALMDDHTRRFATGAASVRPKLAWVRGRALAALGRVRDAAAEFEAGLAAATSQGMRYDQARLLEARFECGQRHGGAFDPSDALLAQEIREGLGILPRPSV
jgi:class 3 adenylate cyclase/tetratricopeptide (TPR) repeat protein